MSPELISDRGSKICRGCEGTDLLDVLDLGAQPLPSEDTEKADEVLELFPLVLRVCETCGLGQLGEFVLPERIFHPNYPYVSSASSTWLDHSANHAKGVISQLNLTGDSLVVELASNDDYLLSIFQKSGSRVLGVEPANNVAEMARAQEVPTVVEFFDEDAPRKISEECGIPGRIVANNVFAHIPDMRDFTEGIAVLSGDKTIVTSGIPPVTTLPHKRYLDTVYPELHPYLKTRSVKKVSADFEFEVIEVQELPTHGGSNRNVLTKSGAEGPRPSVAPVMRSEIEAGLLDRSAWTSFARNVEQSLAVARNWSLERKQEGAVVVGYGAAHKGNTFVNSVGNFSRTLLYVVDACIEKQGRFLPGSHIPVLPPGAMGEASPTDVLILPWNIACEISQRIRKVLPDLRIWVAGPELRQVA